MKAEAKYMQRCLQLAALGLGNTAPNPLVGSVVVWDHQILGEGYHHRAGQAHAEVEAIRSVKDESRLAEATLYVNLEPCNHTGKTPPCTDLILSKKIPRVVIGQKDPNPLVSGSGIQRLRSMGVEVVEDFLRSESENLNRRFNCFHQKGRPYIILKWAQTQDGFIDYLRGAPSNTKAAWITDEYCRMLVHKWRSEETAILVGTKTALLDNPQLNVRAWSGRDPIRIVIDRFSVLPENLHLFDKSQRTLVFSEKPKPDSLNLEYFGLNSSEDDLPQVLDQLFTMEIQSLLVEGGAELLNSLINKGLWDEARVFTGPGKFGAGVSAPVFNFRPYSHQQTGNSVLELFKNEQ